MVSVRILALSLVAFFAFSQQIAHADWNWMSTSNKMSDERWGPSYCLLGDGESCLIAGGFSYQYGWCVATADLFQESTKRFTKLESRLHRRRDFAPATLLNDGDVLICGGFNDVLGSLNSAELYESSSKQFVLLGNHMLSPRELHTATLLKSGEVLIVGGLNLTVRHTQKSAELYDPLTRSFSPTNGSMKYDRFGHAACRLTDGRVLIVGGTSALFGHGGYSRVLSSAEIYDPATGTFSETASPMTIGRDRPTANLLPDGRVLISGGQGPGGESVDYAEVFDPVSGIFSKISSLQTEARMAHNAGNLPDGKILITGGWSAPIHSTTASTEEFDPSLMKFSPCPPLPFSSHDAAQVVFPDGMALVAGGKSVTNKNVSTSISAGVWAIP